MATPADYSTKANTAHSSKYNWYANGWMLDSPLATNEGGIDIMTDVRQPQWYKNEKGKTGGIDVRHFEGFCQVRSLECWEGNWVLIEILNHPTPFISVADCLKTQSGYLWEPEQWGQNLTCKASYASCPERSLQKTKKEQTSFKAIPWRTYDAGAITVP